MFTFLLFDFVVLSTCCKEMHGMSLYEVLLLYMHNVSLNDYMVKVGLGMNEVIDA